MVLLLLLLLMMMMNSLIPFLVDRIKLPSKDISMANLLLLLTFNEAIIQMNMLLIILIQMNLLLITVIQMKSVMVVQNQKKEECKTCKLVHVFFHPR